MPQQGQPVGWDETGKPIYQEPKTQPGRKIAGYDESGTPVYEDPTGGRSAASRAIGGFLTASGLNPEPVVSRMVEEASKPAKEQATLPLRMVGETLLPLSRLPGAARAFREGRYTDAANEFAASIPLLGPASEHASERWKSGDTAGGIGETAGLAFQPFMMEGIPPAVRFANAARRMGRAPAAARFTQDVMKSIPPGMTRGSYTVADLERATPYLASEHGSSPVISVEGFIDAADSGITQIEEHLGTYLQAHGSDRLRTNPLAAARRALSSSVKAGDMEQGIAALQGYGLDQPKTIAQADAIRLRLNDENKSIMQQNRIDRATARRTDPAFAAREAAANALRDGIYGQLEERGIEGVRALRQDEGALIRVRDAAERQKYAGDRKVGGTGANTVKAKLLRAGIPAAGIGVGSAVGGTPGAIVGGVMGNELAGRIVPPNLTRDALMERGFSRLGASKPPTYPAVPPTRPPAGLLPSHPTSLPSPPDPSFVRGVPAMVQPPNPARMLPPAPHVRQMPANMSGELLPSHDPSRVTTIPARGIIVRDPKTGRFKRVFTTEGAQ